MIEISAEQPRNRVFLAPLFFTTRFCRHCLRVSYKRNPDQLIWRYEMERMPPLGRLSADGVFTPDYHVLLMFDEVVIDGEAFDRLHSRSRPRWFEKWTPLVDALRADGALQLADTQSIARSLARTRGGMLRLDMRQFEEWAHAIEYHEALMRSANEALEHGRGMYVWKSGEGVFPPNTGTAPRALDWRFDHHKKPAYMGDDRQTHSLGGIIAHGKITDTQDVHFGLQKRAIVHLRSHLSNLNAALAVSAHLRSAPMLWAPYNGYLARKRLRTEGSVHDTSAAQAFFKVAFPDYAPKTMKDFLRLRSDRRLVALRGEIQRAAMARDLVDPRYPERVLTEVLRIEQRLAKLRTITSWAANLVGLVPLPGLGAIASAAGEIAGAIVAKKARGSHAWFYLISDGVGHS